MTDYDHIASQTMLSSNTTCDYNSSYWGFKLIPRDLLFSCINVAIQQNTKNYPIRIPKGKTVVINILLDNKK